MAHQHRIVQAHRIEPGVKVADMVGKTVREVGLGGLAHTDQVRRQAPGLARHVRNVHCDRINAEFS
jgi:hypothetical protein